MPGKLIRLTLMLCLFTTVASAQKKAPAVPDQLYKDVARADSLLFSAFNNCDSVTYRKFLKDDFEFYHDLGGLNVGVDYEMRAFREMCQRGNHIRRELIKSTLEVYPIKDYGAVEIGVHTFYHTNKGQTQEKVSGTYKFVQVWQFKDGLWKLARVISYGHNEMHND
ncbi:nuclear transport factor 2 family protein [Mucilaginibacter sp. CAU 1740]|uniref:nuclear transport factor 2 family protein n=1 Tax=Mucilaginibacter sp. CAU 1740 TaxID=3140365 RepID=UPI00325BC07C